jgi:hypothetical protein
MFDALLYCAIMAEIKHGYFLIVADFVRTITAQFRALWARRTPVACRQCEAWMQSLARLETYVATMA